MVVAAPGPTLDLMTKLLGYRVANEAGIPFLDAFTARGGVETLGYPLTRRFIPKLRKARKLLASSVAHRVCKLPTKIAEERERLIGGPLHSHEQHGNLR